MIHRPFPALACIVSLGLLAGCGGDAPRAQAGGEPAKPGSFQEGGVLTPFYGEEVHDNRLYVFGKKKTWEAFQTSHEMDPQKCRRLIGQGPGRMTLIIETTKDEPAMDRRILETVKQRYNLDLS